MRVLLVAQQLRRAAPGGIGTYLRGLVQGLEALDDPPEVTLFGDRHALPGPLLTRAWDRGVLRAPRGFDLVHSPALATPASPHAPLVVAVHDVAWRRVPESFPPRGRRWHEAALRRAVKRRALLVTPSDETADELVDAGAHPSAVHVLDPMYGCDHLPPADTEGAAAVLARCQVRGPYLLTVGTLEPRKNLPGLVQAFLRARPSLPEPWPLVVVGPAGWGDGLEPAPGVVFTGPVPAPVLAGLYAGARCTAYVPLYEGFGLPAVESMAACAPVVASTGLPSVAGAALEVDPTDVGALAQALVVAAGDDRRRAELVTAGLLRAADLTWAAAARRHVELWERLA
ncbi:MAG TPA: glycosyltransferase family 1 protein [Acidimicrobiales bacterium]|nr:glycosyltransferase family 1 protein [Acidimicrobiales bacterium]